MLRGGPPGTGKWAFCTCGSGAAKPKISEVFPPGRFKTLEDGRNATGSLLKMFSDSLRLGLRRLFTDSVSDEISKATKYLSIQ